MSMPTTYLLYLREKLVLGLAPPFGVEEAELGAGVAVLSVLVPESWRASLHTPRSVPPEVDGPEQNQT